MFLLLLMGLGAAGVKAQVRIGGNAAPNASAVLDLNATDATMNGTKGLALPRVDLTSATMLLPGVTSNLTGMMVYNTTATLGRIGIYYWNGATWVNASLPSTSAADSGKYLMSDGSTWSAQWISPVELVPTTSLPVDQSATPITWTWILSKSATLTLGPWNYVNIPAQGLLASDFCMSVTPAHGGFNISTMNGYLQVLKLWGSPKETHTLSFRCYRPSL